LPKSITGARTKVRKIPQEIVYIIAGLYLNKVASTQTENAVQ